MADGEELKESVVVLDRLECIAADLLSEDKENLEYDRAIAELICEARGAPMEKAPKVLAELWRRKQAASMERAEELRKIEASAAAFLMSFEGVFEDDWDHTKGCLGIEDDSELAGFIEEGHTFLNPGVADEQNNWSTRGALLSGYRQLRRLLDDADEHVVAGALKKPT